MDVRFPRVWLPAELLARTKRDRYGEGIGRGVIGPIGGTVLLAKLAWGWYFFLPRVFLLMVGDRWLRCWREDSGSIGEIETGR